MWRRDVAGFNWQTLPAVLNGQATSLQGLPTFIGQTVSGEGEVKVGTDAAYIVVNQHELAGRGLTVLEGDVITAFGQDFKVGLVARDRTLGILRCEVRPVKNEANLMIDRGKNLL